MREARFEHRVSRRGVVRVVQRRRDDSRRFGSRRMLLASADLELRAVAAARQIDGFESARPAVDIDRQRLARAENALAAEPVDDHLPVPPRNRIDARRNRKQNAREVRAAAQLRIRREFVPRESSDCDVTINPTP